MNLFDSLLNVVSALGTSRDKRSAIEHVDSSETETGLTTFYRESWLAKKIVNVPAYDSFREWRRWHGDDEQIELIEREEQRLDLLRVYMKAVTFARLYGFSAIYISTGDADVSKELHPSDIKKGGLRFLNVFLPRQLVEGDLNYDPESPYFMRPQWYELNTNATINATANADLTGVRIHASRMIIFEGESVPDPELTIRGNGRRSGGDSVLKSRKAAILDAEATAANIASLIYEAKVDVVKIPNLFANLLDRNYQRQLVERFALAATLKGNNGMLVLDNEEEYEQKSAQFNNLAELMNTFVQQVSGAADIPITRLLGQSPGGLNSTGESDLRNYYDHISAQQKVVIGPTLAPLDEMVIRSALGDYPADLFYEWASLWQLSSKELAEIGKMNAETIAKLVDTGLYPQDALANVGANLMVETGVLPGFLQYLEEANGTDDNEEAREELRRMEEERIARQATQATNSNDHDILDGPPGPKPLYVRRDVLNAAEIIKHYEQQGLADLLDAAKMHVTIVYSERPVDWFKTGEAWDAQLKLSAGGARDNAKFGPVGQENALVLMFSSSELRWRHEAFIAAGAVSSYEDYLPHITLKCNDTTPIEDYENIEPYRGEIVLGPEIYENPNKDWAA